MRRTVGVVNLCNFTEQFKTGLFKINFFIMICPNIYFILYKKIYSILFKNGNDETYQ